jgi:hypothetical protein
LQNEVEYFIIKTATNCYTSKIPKSKDLKKQFFNLFHIDLSTSKDVGKDVLLRTENRNSDMLGIILVLKESHSLTSVIREIKSVTNHIDITK